MDIFDVLKQEHKELNSLLEQAEETTERAEKTRTELLSKIRTSLLLHAKAEEKSLYKRLKGEETLEDLLLEAAEEHEVAEHVLSELDGLDTADETWKAKVTVLHESIEHHVKEEEDEMFPKAKKCLAEGEAEELAVLFKEEKAKAAEKLA